MAFLDGLGKKISQTGQDVVQKTKDTAEILKINGLISDEEKQIETIYTELGKRYFESHTDSYEQDYALLITTIKESKGKIAAYEEQVKKLKGLVPCPICGADVAYGAPFCSTCGAQLANPAAAQGYANGNVNRCTNCGVPLSEGSSFCTNCGTKVQPAAQPQPQPQPVVRACPNCGKEIAEGANFCVGCGFKI